MLATINCRAVYFSGGIGTDRRETGEVLRFLNNPKANFYSPLPRVEKRSSSLGRPLPISLKASMRAMYSVPQRRLRSVKEAVLGLLIVTDCQSSADFSDEEEEEEEELPEDPPPSGMSSKSLSLLEST